MDSGAWNLKHRFFIPSKKVVPYLIINNLLKRALPRREKIIRSGVVISLNFLNHACMQLAGFVIKSMKLNSQISFETTSLGKAGKNEHTGCWGGGAPEWTIATLCSCWEKEKLYYPVYSNSICYQLKKSGTQMLYLIITATSPSYYRRNLKYFFLEGTFSLP